MKMNTRGIELVSVAALVLAALVTPAAAGSKKNLIKMHFLNMGLQPSAQGKLMMVENKAQTRFKIQVKHLEPGDYDVVLDGAVVDTFTANAEGKAKISYRERHQGNKQGAPLPYQPAGGILQIQAAGTALLEARIPSTPEESFERTEIEIELASMGVAPGEAEAEFEERFGRMEFEVEIDGAAQGTYELMVDGVKVADIEVGATGSGKVELDSHPSSDDDGDALHQLLTFDPRGKEITIMQSSVSLFSSVFPLTAPL